MCLFFYTRWTLIRPLHGRYHQSDRKEKHYTSLYKISRKKITVISAEFDEQKRIKYTGVVYFRHWASCSCIRALPSSSIFTCASFVSGTGYTFNTLIRYAPPRRFVASLKYRRNFSNDNEKGHNDVFLLTADNYITLSGELTGENPAARITVPDANYQTSTKVLDGTMELINSEHDKFTVTPKDLGGGSTQQWEVTANGSLQPKP